MERIAIFYTLLVKLWSTLRIIWGSKWPVWVCQNLVQKSTCANRSDWHGQWLTRANMSSWNAFKNLFTEEVNWIYLCLHIYTHMGRNALHVVPDAYLSINMKCCRYNATATFIIIYILYIFIFYIYFNNNC